MRTLGKGVVHGGTFTAIRSRSPPPRRRCEILDETPALQTIAEYGTKMRSGMSQILAQRGIRHSFSGHPSMSGLFFSETPPHDYRDWASSDYTFYEALAPELHDLGMLCEPDSREPWFVCEAHDRALPRPRRCSGSKRQSIASFAGSRAPSRRSRAS